MTQTSEWTNGPMNGPMNGPNGPDDRRRLEYRGVCVVDDVRPCAGGGPGDGTRTSAVRTPARAHRGRRVFRSHQAQAGIRTGGGGGMEKTRLPHPFSPPFTPTTLHKSRVDSSASSVSFPMSLAVYTA